MQVERENRGRYERSLDVTFAIGTRLCVSRPGINWLYIYLAIT